MEKVNYGFVFEKNYPTCKWSVAEGKKGYDYTAYIWDSLNQISKPSKEQLDQLWQTSKRDTWIWQRVIKDRNQLLIESDRYALPDFPHASEQIKQAWLDYRQALRDITETAEPIFSEAATIEGVAWPQKPC